MLDSRFVKQPGRTTAYEVVYICAVCGIEHKKMVSVEDDAMSSNNVPEGMACIRVFVKVSKTDYSKRNYEHTIQIPVCDCKSCLNKGPRKVLTLISQKVT